MRRVLATVLAACCLPVVWTFSPGVGVGAVRPGILPRNSDPLICNKQQGLLRGSSRERASAGGLRGLKAIGGTAELKAIIRNYGLAALATHFIGWVVCMTTLITLFHTIGPEQIFHVLPEGLRSHIDVDFDKSRFLVEIQMALAATEAVGPLRLGFTIGVAPKVSDQLRKYPVTRDMEAIAIKASRKLARGAAGNAKRNVAFYLSQIKAYGSRLVNRVL